MKQITIKNLQIQFDADQITNGEPSAQVKQAIELINLQLQREPTGLAAQILYAGDYKFTVEDVPGGEHEG